MENYINEVLGGRYEIQEIIGVGGMAVVYKAYDRVDARVVAVKILKDEFLANEEFRIRFRNESKAISMLSHPNIVKVYDVSLGDDIQYIVMEHVEGITLKEYIERQKTVDWKEAVHYVVQILRALQHAHDKGIIHRDIKPQNILVLQNASIKVTDFGIARFNRGNINSYESSTMGSVHYVSPEQATGDFTDEKSDIYSVGVVLYEMLTGRLPFDSDRDEAIAMMQVNSDAVKPSMINSSIPKGLEQITLRAMQKNPDDRYQSAAEFLLDLDEFKRNPQIVFEYSYFIDKDPTKDIKIPIGGSISQIGTELEPEDDEIEEADDEQSGERSNALPILIAIAISLVVVIGIIVGAVLFGNIKSDKNKEGFFSKLDVFGWFSSDKIEVPDFKNMEFEQVLKDYPELAIKNPPNYEYNSIFKEGHVTAQSPEAGSKVSKDTVIELTVATSGEMVLVEDVVGLPIEEAEKKLSDAGLNVVAVESVDESRKDGEVINTLPGANTYTAQGGTVYVYYASSSQGVNSIKVPNVIGYELEAAKAKIIAAGLNVGAITEGASAASLKDLVISQSPSESTSVNAGVYVNIVIGTGIPASNTAQFKITLPLFPNSTTNTIKTFLNGTAYDSIPNVPLDGGSYTLSFTGSGEDNTFEIYMDSTLIYTGDIDFTTTVPTFSNVHAYQFTAKQSVPNVVGETQSQAENDLEAAGFIRIKVLEQYSATVPKGCVITQSPEHSEDNKYSTSTMITIVVSLGADGGSSEITTSHGSTDPTGVVPTTDSPNEDNPGHEQPTGGESITGG